MNWRQLQDDNIVQDSLDAILMGYDTLHNLARSIYRYNEGGPWLEVGLRDGTRVSGEAIRKVSPQMVRALYVQSSPDGGRADPIDLLRIDPEEAAYEFWRAVEYVNAENCAEIDKNQLRE